MHLAGGATMLMVATSLQSTFEVRGTVYAVPFPIGLRTPYTPHFVALCRHFVGRGLHPAVACSLGFYRQRMDQIGKCSSSFRRAADAPPA